MQKFIFSVIFTFLNGLLLVQTSHAADGWTQIKDSSGIKVYERPVAGTGLMEYVGVTTVDGKMEVIGEVLRDIPQFRLWIADCYGAQIEKKYDRNTFVLYMVLKPPIIEQRDIILKDKAVYDYDNGKAIINFFCTDEVKIPIEKGRTRVAVMNGVFDMEYLGRNKTKFVYRLKVDPAGDIPKKVAYSVMKSYPYDTLKGLKKVVTDKKYSDAAKGTEEEKQINIRATNEAAVRKILTNRLMRFAGDKAALAAIIAASNDDIKNIYTSGGTYDSVEKATTKIFLKYCEKKVSDKAMYEKLKNNKSLIQEMTDMVLYDCGALNTSVDSIVAKYTATLSK
jgi:hypothetical protein